MSYALTASEVAARDASPIEQALARLAHELDVVDGRVHDLQCRLKPVTATAGTEPSGGKTGQNPLAVSELEDKLESMCARTQQISDRVQALIEALRI